jgi:hypothetical protein
MFLKLVKFKDGKYGIRRFDFFYFKYEFLDLQPKYEFWYYKNDLFYIRASEKTAREVMSKLKNKDKKERKEKLKGIVRWLKSTWIIEFFRKDNGKVVK